MNVEKITFKIYIIESPNDNDILSNRFEGKILSNILDMSGIKNQYFITINKK